MKHHYYVNHTAAPSLTAYDFLRLGKEAGFEGIELRNDIGDGDPFTGEKPEEIGRFSARIGMKLAAINALQRCNRSEGQPVLLQELQTIAKQAGLAGVSSIVLCPVNDAGDHRSPAESLRDLEKNLSAFLPILADHNLTGLVEPLGFARSSLRSQKGVIDIIKRIGSPCYRLLLDTFHFALGPDSFTDLERIPVSLIGMVHVSGVDEDLPKGDMTDDHRVLVGPGDRLDTLGHIRVLLDRGYDGPLSFEPFAPRYRSLEMAAALEEIRRSLAYLRGVLE